jgi:hypothetical protein
VHTQTTLNEGKGEQEPAFWSCVCGNGSAEEDLESSPGVVELCFVWGKDWNSGSRVLSWNRRERRGAVGEDVRLDRGCAASEEIFDPAHGRDAGHIHPDVSAGNRSDGHDDFPSGNFFSERKLFFHGECDGPSQR